MDTVVGFTGPVNLGNPTQECTILELAKRIIALTGSSSKIVYRGLPKDDPERRKPDIKKASWYLEWHPKKDLDQGLTQTINYFRGLREKGEL